ncbi:MAG TPA: hypothetical protein VMZ69_04775 [Saprospiraceae bacterium]|nr:hypothetical protein [Saprospiraceae bacterium]
MELNKSFHIYVLLQRSMYLRAILLTFAMFIFHIAQAQQNDSTDFMRSVGKIYVVAAVCLVILLSLFIYMIIIDRKITRIEKRQKQ